MNFYNKIFMPNIQIRSHFFRKLLSGQVNRHTHQTNCSTCVTKVIDKGCGNGGTI